MTPDFLEDYDKSKQRRSLDAGMASAAAPPPIPKPRQLVSAASEDVPAGAAELSFPVASDSPKPSLRTRSSSLTIHDKRSVPVSEDLAQVEKADLEEAYCLLLYKTHVDGEPSGLYF